MAELEEDYVFEREIGEQETKVDREHDRILKEIETTDTAFVGASLRAVYEGNDHEKFTEKLDSRIKQHDRDIERLCNFHYQGFIESITELIKVRSDAETLKKQVVVINKELQESGKELARKCEDLMQCRLQQRNIASAIDQLSMCLPVLHTYAKMQDQMEAGRYYSALKTLEQLEHTYLPRVHEYRFCEIMIENIPKIRERIKEVSMSELKDFLEVVRRKSGQIGSLAMSQVDKERKLENLTEADGNTGAQRNSILFQESPTEADRNHLSKNEYRRRHSKKKNRKKSDEKQQDVNPNQRLNPFDQSLDDLDSSNPFAERNGDSSNPFEETNHNGIDTNPFEVADDASDDEDEADRIENLVPQNSKLGNSQVPDTTGNAEKPTIVIIPEDLTGTQDMPQESPVIAPPPRRKKKKRLAPATPEEQQVDNDSKKIETETQEIKSKKKMLSPPSDLIFMKESEKGSANSYILAEAGSESVHLEHSMIEEDKELEGEERTEDCFIEESLANTGNRLGVNLDLKDNAFEFTGGITPPVTPRKEKKRQYMPLVLQDISPSDLVDFSPVYKCLHIFGILKSHDEFKKYYRSQRSRQASIALQPPTNMHESLEGYSSYCHQIVGFFVVEDHILHTAQNLIDRIYIDSLWDKALLEIISVFRTDSDYCGGADMLMSVKNLIVVFADTLKAYGFIVDQLFSLLIEMRDQYSDILLKKWSDLLQTIFDEDNYTPIQVNSDSEAIRLLSSFPYEDTEFEKASFPKYLPFSRFVPNVFNEIKRFILACLEYCEDLHLSSTEVDDMIRKSTNLLLTRTLSGELQKLVRKSSLGLTELVQITINTSYLENSCKHVEQFVHSVTGVDSSASHTAKLVGVSTFKDARCETESQIYLKLNSKIDEFFDLADYNWNVSEPLGTASSYLLDLIAFLKHNFKVFTHLPEKVAQTGCMSACKHISTRLMELVMDREMRQVTMAALQQFNLDVMQCELFSNSEPVPGFQDGALQMSFLELRQLLDLFLSWDWSSYLADYGSGSSKYLRVNPATALALLEKVREDSKHRNIFTSFTRQEREKKKLLETVLKQLRNIVNVPEEHVSQAPAPAPKIWNYLENKFLSKKVV